MISPSKPCHVCECGLWAFGVMGWECSHCGRMRNGGETFKEATLRICAEALEEEWQ